MSTILPFQFQPEKVETKTLRRQAVSGKIIIFPGVRYERLPDVSLTVTKTPKKTRKIA